MIENVSLNWKLDFFADFQHFFKTFFGKTLTLGCRLELLNLNIAIRTFLYCWNKLSPLRSVSQLECEHKLKKKRFPNQFLLISSKVFWRFYNSLYGYQIVNSNFDLLRFSGPIEKTFRFPFFVGGSLHGIFFHKSNTVYALLMLINSFRINFPGALCWALFRSIWATNGTGKNPHSFSDTFTILGIIKSNKNDNSFVSIYFHKTKLFLYVSHQI